MKILLQIIYKKLLLAIVFLVFSFVSGLAQNKDSLYHELACDLQAEMQLEVKNIDEAISSYIKFLTYELDTIKTQICLWYVENTVTTHITFDKSIDNQLKKLSLIFLQYPDKFEYMNQDKLKYENSKLDRSRNKIDENSIFKELSTAKNKLQGIEKEYEKGKIDVSRYLDLKATIKNEVEILEQKKKGNIQKHDLMEKIVQKFEMDYFIFMDIWDSEEAGKIEMRIRLMNQFIDEMTSTKKRSVTRWFLIKGKNKPTKELDIPPFKPTFEWNASASFYFGQKKYELALENWLKVIKGKPKNSHVAFQIGLCYYYLEEYQNAIRFFDKSNTDDISIKAEYFNYVGLSYLKIGKVEKAQEYFETFKELNPLDGKAEKNFALYFSVKKNYRDAYIYFKKAMGLGFNDWGWIKTESYLQGFRDTRFYKKLKKMEK